MTCREFQQALAESSQGQTSAEQRTHLNGCAACALLVQDLRVIQEQASLLALEEPGPQVWIGIRAALEQEGLIRDAAPAPVLRPRWPLPRFLWKPAWQVGAMAAALALVFGMIVADAVHPLRLTPAADLAAVQPALAGDDLTLLEEVETHSPALRPAYEESLRGANAYIADAQRSLVERPHDAQARELLMRAYQQKAAIYEMAMTHSVESIR